MKEIVNFFSGRRYSAVNTSEMQMMGAGQKTRKSLQAKPTLDRGISVIDALFNERQSGKQMRWPKSKSRRLRGAEQCNLNASVNLSGSCRVALAT
jgi:hypothetical protein